LPKHKKSGELRTRRDIALSIRAKLEGSRWPTPSLPEILDVLEAFFSTIRDHTVVHLKHFGTFQWKLRKERIHFNLGSKKMEPIPPKRSLAFVPSKTLKRRVQLDG
jgi:nucleoid DNA-binding protein